MSGQIKELLDKFKLWDGELTNLIQQGNFEGYVAGVIAEIKGVSGQLANVALNAHLYSVANERLAGEKQGLRDEIQQLRAANRELVDLVHRMAPLMECMPDLMTHEIMEDIRRLAP